MTTYYLKNLNQRKDISNRIKFKDKKSFKNITKDRRKMQ